MQAKELPERPSLEQYERLAADLVLACDSGDPDAIRRVREHYGLERQPTLDELREHTRRRLRKLSGSENPGPQLSLADAQLLVADAHGFQDWSSLVGHIAAVQQAGSPVWLFDAAADAVVAGDIAALESLLSENPELVSARATRQHQSTLLHYVSANGVEDFRQKTPKNAVQIARLLLEKGALVDAENNLGRGTTLGLAATSYHPAAAGVQIALLETLLDAGAAVDGAPGGWNPLLAALHNGRGDAAAFLAQRGARLDLEGAAGAGRLDVVESFFGEDGALKANATTEQMKSGFTWACEFGRTGVVDFLLQRGMALDARLKHDGQTGLHWAGYGGHLELVRLLLERNAPVDVEDESYGGTPLGWTLYGWVHRPPEARDGRYHEVVALLVKAGARVDPQWLEDDADRQEIGAKVRADPRMRAALGGDT